MPRLRMTKAMLAERRRALATYRLTLPSLRLKREQLARELAAARVVLHQVLDRLATARQAASRIPFAADRQVAFEHLVQLDGVTWHSERRLGVDMPARFEAHWQIMPYRLEVTPPWLDMALDAIIAEGDALLAVALASARVEALARGLGKAVQRVNLVEQRLEPEARRDIARISQLLADGERTQLARSKLARRQVAIRADEAVLP